MSFISSVIRSSQEYDMNMAGTASVSITPAQNLQYSMIDILGVYVGGDVGVNPGYSRGNTAVVLSTSGSTVTAQRNTGASASGTIVTRIRVTEYVSALMAAPVARGTIVISTSSGLGIGNLARAMDSRSVLRFLGFRILSGEDITQSSVEVRIYQLNATQIQAQTAFWGGYTREAGYEVVYWR